MHVSLVIKRSQEHWYVKKEQLKILKEKEKMIKRARKISLTVLTAMLMAVTTISPAFATDETQTTTEAGTRQTTVTYTQDSSFTVTIPKTITLDTSKEATYDVKVQGDIKGNEVITVTPDSTITLNDADGKGAVTGNIEQTKTKFNSTEVNQTDGASATGTITANDLTAGDWSGSISFTIGKAQEVTGEDTGVIGQDIALDKSNRATYGIATTGDVEIPKYVTDSDRTKHKVVALGTSAFENCKDLTSITIPDSVTSIGQYAFYDCKGLTSITIPDSVTRIIDNAFSNCTVLTSITIPDSVTSIGSDVFGNCTGLISITIPNSVKSIKTRAFVNCTNLASVTYKGQTYTSKSALTTALTDNNITVEPDVFVGTALTD